MSHLHLFARPDDVQHRHRILVADDDLARPIAMLLTRNGCNALAVCDGQAALDIAGSTPFDLWLLNYRMPHLTGIAVLRALRDRNLATPAIILTAWPRTAVPEPTNDLGIAAWIQKPFSNRALVDEITDVLGASSHDVLH